VLLILLVPFIFNAVSAASAVGTVTRVSGTATTAEASTSHAASPLSNTDTSTTLTKTTPTGITYITMVDDKGATIVGGFSSKGDPLIPVLSLEHQVTSPRDSASGQATGKRVHKPLVFTKELDKSTPILYRVFATGATLPTVTISKLLPLDSRAAFSGTNTNVFNTILTDVQIAQIDRRLDNRDLMETETISLTYDRIQWTWVDGGVTHYDTWETKM
jgi:type VI secretion system secreted protein Hcp